MYVIRPALGATEAALLPPCYSQELDDCIEERNVTYPNCQAILQAYERDFDATEAAVDALPYCSEKALPAEPCELPLLFGKYKQTPLFWGTVGAAAGIVAISIIWSLVG